MKDELSKKLVEVIGAIQNGVGKASDFAVEQLPDIAQQYIVYGRVVESFWIILAGLIVALAIASVIYAVANDDDVDKMEPALCVAIPSALVGGVMVAANISSFVMVWFAPKIYLIKGLAGLIK